MGFAALCFVFPLSPRSQPDMEERAFGCMQRNKISNLGSESKARVAAGQNFVTKLGSSCLDHGCVLSRRCTLPTPQHISYNNGDLVNCQGQRTPVCCIRSMLTAVTCGYTQTAVIRGHTTHRYFFPTVPRGMGQCLQARYRLLANRVRSSHCLLYTSPSPRDRTRSRMPSSA